MVTIEQKLKLFSKIVVDKLNKEYESMIHKMDKDDELALNTYKKDLARRASDYRKELLDKGTSERKRTLSKAKVENRKDVLSKRAEYVEHVKELLLQKVREFTETEEYTHYLMESFNQVPDELLHDAIIIYLTKSDYAKHGKTVEEKLSHNQDKALKIEFSILDDEYIGGYLIFSGDRRVKLDGTLLSVIEENTENIGKRVNKLLDEVGDSNE